MLLPTTGVFILTNYRYVRVAIIEFLVSAGADINAQDVHGQTPLHYAVACQQFPHTCRMDELIATLLRLGARTDITDVFGNTPAAAAAVLLARSPLWIAIGDYRKVKCS